MRSQEFGPSLEAQWVRVRARLKGEFGEAAYKSWLKPLTLVGVEDGTVRIAVPTRFMQDWVRQHYADRIKTLWRAENKLVRTVEVVVQPAAGVQAPAPVPATGSAQRPTASAAPARPAATPAGAAHGYAAPAIARSADDVEDFGAQLDPRFTFQSFVHGKSNEFAAAAARRVAEEAKVPFNPLFLYGGVGLGKTHLMHAIAWHIRKRNPQRRVLYLSAEKFMYQFIRAMRFKDTMSFKEQFRSVDVLLVDDVQFIAGKDATQEEFFHTFNALVDQNKQIVLSADKSPADLEGLEDRVRSRLGWGLVADIHPTTYELRLGILQSKAEKLGVAMPPKVLEFLAHKIVANIRELEGALNRIVAHSTLVGRPIGLESAQEVLHDLLRASDRRVTIEEIQKKVAEHFAIRLADMHSPRRARQVARPRQVAMYLAKQLTSRSLPEIGRKFGGRDHTTVMHAVRKIDELRAADAAFSEDVELLRRMLEA
ncbi:MAG: chromosomal replication initiator protein DnaA [Rhodospirillales bacterium]|nr:chromosomal replication initiator protein DnaA [Rhodospirillales bacterium]